KGEKSQPEVRNAPERSKEKSPFSSQNQPAPRAYQPVPATPSGPAATRPPDEPKQPARAKPADRSDVGPRSYLPDSAAQGQPDAGRKDSWRQNPHEYHPKGYYQSSETRSKSKSDERQETQ